MRPVSNFLIMQLSNSRGRLTEKPVKLGEASRSRHSGIPVQTERLKY